MRAISIGFVAAMTLFTIGCHAGDEVTAVVSSERPTAESFELSSLPAVSVDCGFSVVTDLKLGNDLSCPGDGLIVNADGITIDLNGHTILGSGAGIGITVRARHDVDIHGGTIIGFVTGIFVANSSTVVIRENGFTQNREAIFLNGSSDNVVKENEAWQNQLRGIMLRPTNSGVISTRNQVVENVLRENPSGILVFGQPGNTLKENWITASSFAAIDLTGGGATGNMIKENMLTTSAVGIFFGPGWTGNAVVENQLVQNTCAMQGAIVGNAIAENEFIGNGADFC
jgi:parallel beta-helix repeat protein